MLKKIVAASFLLIALSAKAGELKTFDAVAKNIKAGKGLRFLIRLKQCEGSGTMPLPKDFSPIGSYKPSSVMLLDNMKIAASDLHLTTNDFAAPGQPVYEYVLYTITPDNKVVMSTKAYSAGTFTALGSTLQFNCELGAGVKLYSSH